MEPVDIVIGDIGYPPTINEFCIRVTETVSPISIEGPQKDNTFSVVDWDSLFCIKLFEDKHECISNIVVWENW